MKQAVSIALLVSLLTIQRVFAGQVDGSDGVSNIRKRANNPISTWTGVNTHAYEPPNIPMPHVFEQHIYHPPPMPKEILEGEVYDDLIDPVREDEEKRRRRRPKSKGKKSASRKLLQKEKPTSDDENTLIVEGLAPSPMESGGEHLRY